MNTGLLPSHHDASQLNTLLYKDNPSLTPAQIVKPESRILQRDGRYVKCGSMQKIKQDFRDSQGHLTQSERARFSFMAAPGEEEEQNIPDNISKGQFMLHQHLDEKELEIAKLRQLLAVERQKVERLERVVHKSVMSKETQTVIVSNQQGEFLRSRTETTTGDFSFVIESVGEGNRRLMSRQSTNKESVEDSKQNLFQRPTESDLPQLERIQDIQESMFQPRTEVPLPVNQLSPTAAITARSPATEHHSRSNSCKKNSFKTARIPYVPVKQKKQKKFNFGKSNLQIQVQNLLRISSQEGTGARQTPTTSGRSQQAQQKFLSKVKSEQQLRSKEFQNMMGLNPSYSRKYLDRSEDTTNKSDMKSRNQSISSINKTHGASGLRESLFSSSVGPLKKKSTRKVSSKDLSSFLRNLELCGVSGFLESQKRLASQESYDRVQEMLLGPCQGGLHKKNVSSTSLHTMVPRDRSKTNVNVPLNYRRDVRSPVKSYILSNQILTESKLKLPQRKKDYSSGRRVMPSREWIIDRSDVTERSFKESLVCEKLKVLITQIRPKQRASPPPQLNVGSERDSPSSKYQISPIKISEGFEGSRACKEGNVSFEKCEINYPDLLFEQDIAPGRLLHQQTRRTAYFRGGTNDSRKMEERVHDLKKLQKVVRW